MTFTQTDLDRLAGLIKQAATQEILPRFQTLSQKDIKAKTSRMDLVTTADVATEAWLKAEIAKAFPQAVLIGEEGTEQDKSQLHQLAHADLAILLDPVDGTNNFAWDVPLFGMLAAVVVRGETVAGLIYDPLTEELNMCLKSHGAQTYYKSGRTEDLKINSPSLNPEDLAGIVSWSFAPEPLRSKIAQNMPKFKACFTYRCAVYEYRLIAKGHLDFSLYHKTMPWDHAAGTLLYQEAGGYSAHYNGNPYRPENLKGGLINAPTRGHWEMISTTLLN